MLFSKLANTSVAPTKNHLQAAKRISGILEAHFIKALHLLQVSLLCLPTMMLIGLGTLLIVNPLLVWWSFLVIVISSTEAKYRAMASAAAELCWIRILLKELGIFLPHPPLLWCDNVSTIAIV